MEPWRPLLHTFRHVRDILPIVDRELAGWRNRASHIPDPALRQQALASIDHKRFHCEGGAVFALQAGSRAPDLVALIVALQTISDYLDNLGDRAETQSERDFRTVHTAMRAAVHAADPIDDYYRFHPHHDDGGYLQALVQTCRDQVLGLPYFHSVQRHVARLVELYCDLQVYKHLPVDEREERLVEWYRRYAEGFEEPPVTWWEYGAACGSTLGVFALFLEALREPGEQAVEALLEAYFPWICGVHILLDYFIDQAEDRREGDLNFVAYYEGADDAANGMVRMMREARNRCRMLPDRSFHLAVFEGLPALYLSDPKVNAQGLRRHARRMLRVGGIRSRLVHAYCTRWRRGRQEVGG